MTGPSSQTSVGSGSFSKSTTLLKLLYIFNILSVMCVPSAHYLEREEGKNIFLNQCIHISLSWTAPLVLASYPPKHKYLPPTPQPPLQPSPPLLASHALHHQSALYLPTQLPTQPHPHPTLLANLDTEQVLIIFKRVRTRVVAVVVVVRELLFLVMSVICVRIRGRGSEVTTTPYHIHSVFCLKRFSYHNGFVVLFLHCHENRKHLGTLHSLAP